jgi:predicted phage terminase large subunit-like protein
MKKYAPQPGPQTQFCAHSAQIVVYGGAAGGGKSVGLLLDVLRYATHPGYRAVIFRRTSPQITAGGGLWDAASEIYSALGAKSNISAKEWVFPNGAKVAFRHLQHEKHIYDWQGAELDYIGFDEGTHFTNKQFIYLMSRNRSKSGIPTYMRLTCNPDAGSWLAGFLSWWIDQQTGYPIPDRSGKVRYFYRVGDDFLWYSTKREAMAAHPDLARDPTTGTLIPPKSVTFIPSKLSDNAIFCAKNPEYRQNLMSQSIVERSRLLDGNWKITAADGMFRAEWFPVFTEAPVNWKKIIRAWDFAATEPNDKNDPDYTVGVKMGLDAQGGLWVLDVVRVRYSPARVLETVIATAKADTSKVTQVIEQEPGSSGKYMVSDIRDKIIKELGGLYTVQIDKADKRTGDKVTRAQGYSAAAEQGKFRLLAGAWNASFTAEHSEFPFGAHDDQVDAASSAFRRLTQGGPILVM